MSPALAAADHRTLQPEHELYSLVDIFTYTTMISQCNSHHQLRRALELVAEMRSRAVPLNVHTYSALLNVCLKANELDLSLDVYAQMLSESCTPNLVTYNTLLDIYNKTGRWIDALNVMELLQHQVRGRGAGSRQESCRRIATPHQDGKL
jgi:pentatricopeptide repeat domain-containing protein 1